MQTLLVGHAIALEQLARSEDELCPPVQQWSMDFTLLHLLLEVLKKCLVQDSNQADLQKALTYMYNNSVLSTALRNEVS